MKEALKIAHILHYLIPLLYKNGIYLFQGGFLKFSSRKLAKSFHPDCAINH